MEIFLYLLVGFFGAIIGSFLNVVIFRYHSGATFLGRSMCFSCGKTLRWHDLVPVFSFFALAGKCRFCRSKISWQYAAVESITGILFMLFFWKMGGSAALAVSFLYFAHLIFLFTLGSLLVVIGGYDIKHKIIPDVFAYSFAALALLKLIFLPQFVPISWDFFAGPILAFPFALLWYFSRGRWMGLGDAKIALGIGWFLGLSAGLTAVVLSFWIGAIFGLALIAIGKFTQSTFFASVFRQRITMKSEIPFAPFLIIGLLLTFFIPRIMESVSLFLY
jgi:leader peptidase (prepilin peptidase)/N-methyltransferase